jgi:hypothetical protein
MHFDMDIEDYVRGYGEQFFNVADLKAKLQQSKEWKMLQMDIMRGLQQIRTEHEEAKPASVGDSAPSYAAFQNFANQDTRDFIRESQLSQGRQKKVNTTVLLAIALPH